MVCHGFLGGAKWICPSTVWPLWNSYSFLPFGNEHLGVGQVVQPGKVSRPRRRPSDVVRPPSALRTRHTVGSRGVVLVLPVRDIGADQLEWAWVL